MIFCVPYRTPFGGTPVAGFIILHPGIQFKSVECDPAATDRDLGEEGPYLGIEAITVHAEVKWCIAKANESRKELDRQNRGGFLTVY